MLAVSPCFSSLSAKLRLPAAGCSFHLIYRHAIVVESISSSKLISPNDKSLPKYGIDVTGSDVSNSAGYKQII